MELAAKIRTHRGMVLRFSVVVGLGAVVLGVVAFRSWTPDYMVCTTRSVAPNVQVAEEGVLEGLRLTHVLALEQATSAEFMPDGTLLATSKPGQLVVADDARIGREILDLSGEVMSEGFEQGLFDIAVSEKGNRLYLSYTGADGGHLYIVEYNVSEGAPDPETKRTVIVIDQPGSTHNGGGLVVDSKGMLWVSVGDGQAARLGDFDDWGNALAAQDPSNLYGSLLRIDPEPSRDRGYTIPADNPFVGSEEARDEVWAFGLRNPWRFSFDRETGDLWVADVGQHCWEEINLLRGSDGAGAGANLGWPALEGSHLYRSALPDEHVLPVYEYTHGEDRERCSVVGGHVYRGDLIPELQGWYVFSDSCAGRIWALSLVGGRRVKELGVSVASPVSLAMRPDGEILVVSLQDGVYLLEPIGYASDVSAGGW